MTYQPLLVWRRSYALPLQMQGIRVLGLAKPHQWQVVNKTGGCMYDGFVVARRTNYAIARTVMQERGWCQDMPQVAGLGLRCGPPASACTGPGCCCCICCVNTLAAAAGPLPSHTHHSPTFLLTPCAGV